MDCDLGCQEVISQAWRINVVGFNSFHLMMKLDNTRRALKKWNKQVFGFCQDKLRLLVHFLEEVQNRVHSQQNLELEATIQLEIVEV